ADADRLHRAHGDAEWPGAARRSPAPRDRFLSQRRRYALPLSGSSARLPAPDPSPALLTLQSDFRLSGATESDSIATVTVGGMVGDGRRCRAGLSEAWDRRCGSAQPQGVKRGAPAAGAQISSRPHRRRRRRVPADEFGLPDPLRKFPAKEADDFKREPRLT